MNATPFCGGEQPAPASLEDCLMLVIDTRVDRTRMHNLGDILVIAVCCMLCGGESFYDMEDFGLAKEAWFRTFPDLPNGIPSHDTFNRVFAALAPAKFNACFLKWTEGLAHAGRQAARASPSSSTRGRPPTGSCSGRPGWPTKAARSRRSPNCSTPCFSRAASSRSTPWAAREKAAAKIVGAGADYVISLKGNQETLRAEMAAFLEDAVARDPQELDRFETVEKGHGRRRAPGLPPERTPRLVRGSGPMAGPQERVHGRLRP